MNISNMVMDIVGEFSFSLTLLYGFSNKEAACMLISKVLKHLQEQMMIFLLPTKTDLNNQIMLPAKED